MSPTLPVSPAPSPRSSSLGAKHFIVFQNSVITIDTVEPAAATRTALLSSDVLEALADSELHAITAPGDAAWPLTLRTATPPYDTFLPDVLEGKKYHVWSWWSCSSSVSRQSPLRGPQCVPVPRQLERAQDKSMDRPPSGASDTLGSFNIFAAQKAIEQLREIDGVVNGSGQASWEDDIAYCYEHEARCDYAWDRASLDLATEFRPFSADEFVAPLSAGLKPALTEIYTACQHSLSLDIYQDPMTRQERVGFGKSVQHTSGLGERR
ncbi:hypothetical protein CSUB01_12150 [Colletotrichum sublineola]|uniref:Uncharacterized protein n=1 Tax=Colletotrichum sublineola TaxID=1173701 RepID=A0A066XUL2_COLSU|nr:hypothetical protein CSUB01_12150 [Colletotrichum sublineola]